MEFFWVPKCQQMKWQVCFMPNLYLPLRFFVADDGFLIYCQTAQHSLLIKFQRFGGFVNLSVVSHLWSPYPSRDTAFNEEVLSGLAGVYLAQWSHLWSRHKWQSDDGGNGSVFQDIWWFHSQEEQGCSCSSPASGKPPPWSPPAGISNRNTLTERTNVSTTAEPNSTMTKTMENPGVHEAGKLLTPPGLSPLMHKIRRLAY